MNPKDFFVLMLFSAAAVSCGGEMEIRRAECTVDGRTVEVTEDELRFGWTVGSSGRREIQTAYEIMLDDTREGLKKEESCLWSTGKVISSDSRLIEYSGPELRKGETYWWKVRVWNAEDECSGWCGLRNFMTAADEAGWADSFWIGAVSEQDSGLPEGNDFHTWGLSHDKAAQWGKVSPAAKKSILLRKEFMADNRVESAVIRICGLGHYRLFVNGMEAGSHSLFKPLWSEYDKTVYYNTFDVTDYVSGGENAIGVMLGNGMYNVTGGRYVKFRHSYGPPTLKLEMNIRYADGSTEVIVSDGTWKYSEGPVVFNCIFGGEDYDARREQPGWTRAGFDEDGWTKAVLMNGPDGKLTPQAAPPVTVSATYAVQDFWSPEASRHIFDMGQNLSGFPTVRLQGKPGQKVRLVPAERISSDSTEIIQVTSGSPYWFEYTIKGDAPEEWTPSFSYYGYRYIEVSGADYLHPGGNSIPVILDLKSNFAHLSASSAGSFECSNDLFNRIHSIIDKAVRSNMHAVLTDCPHREKLGWLEQTHLNGPGLLFNYDMRGFFPKIMQDMADSQRPDGLIPDIAPEYVVFQEGFADSPEWGSAVAILPWMYYEWYGDDSLIRKYYPVMKDYVSYLESKAENSLLMYGLGDWCDYGPAPAGYSQNTPAGITATGHFYMVADCTARAAGLVGDSESAGRYSALKEEIAGAFNRRFFNPVTKVYGNGSQCSYAIPLFLGIVPPEHREDVVANLVSAVENADGRLTTGDIGNRYLFQAMAQNGLDDMLYDMHNHYDVPGYGYQIKAGVTALTEQWNPDLGLSWNHFMMGQIEEWFYRSLGGISPDPENPGFRHFFIRPSAAGDLQWVKCSYESVYGHISSEWKIEDGDFVLNVEVPANTTATVVLPFGKSVPVTVGSGRYCFEESIN